MRGRERDFCATARIFFARLLAMCPFVNPPSLSLSPLFAHFFESSRVRQRRAAASKRERERERGETGSNRAQKEKEREREVRIADGDGDGRVNVLALALGHGELRPTTQAQQQPQQQQQQQKQQQQLLFTLHTGRGEIDGETFLSLSSFSRLVCCVYTSRRAIYVRERSETRDGRRRFDRLWYNFRNARSVRFFFIFILFLVSSFRRGPN